MTKRGKVQKGEYGYRDRAKRDRIIISVLLLLSIFVQVAIRSITTMNSFRILFTVTAVLTVLPLGIITSPLFASWKYKTPGKDFYDKVHPHEKDITILYDLILTTKEQVIPLDAVVVHPIGIFGYCPNAKLDEKKAERDLYALFSDQLLYPKIHIMKDINSFERRLNSLKPAADSDEATIEAEAQLLRTLCM